ncbi:50S ribosomal protein L1 [bacterium]|nr:50S ribosomal protein L1 [bacterium]
MRHGKRYRNLRSALDRSRSYTLPEAVELVKRNATAKFDETVEFVANLGVDPRKADQQVRGTVVLPHGTGKTARVLVFAVGELAKAAEEAGADYVGSSELVEKIQGGWTDFDVAIATPDLMREVGKLGKILGPRGLMPNPKTGTVTTDVARAVVEFKGGKIEYRADKEGGVVHAPVGKASFQPQALVENTRALVDALVRAKPSGARGTYIKKMFLSSTMGPSVKLEVRDVAP